MSADFEQEFYGHQLDVIEECDSFNAHQPILEAIPIFYGGDYEIQVREDFDSEPVATFTDLNHFTLYAYQLDRASVAA